MTEPTRGACRAEVVAGGITTTYVVAGHGTTAVLLGTGLPDGRPGIHHLHGRFRVFAPVVPVRSDPEPLANWLDGFLDGLGLCAVLLVVDTRFVSFARAYAAGSPERVRDVVPLPNRGY